MADRAVKVRTMFGRVAAALAIVAAILGLSAGAVSAHVEVVRTDPADGSVLTTSPSKITLSFTDDLSLDLASVELRTASGTKIDVPGVSFGDDHRHLVVTVPPLDDDAYRLSYDVRDPVDLHETSGSLVFGVGTTPVIGGGLDSQGANPADSAFGWVARGGLALVVGGVAMILIVRSRSRHVAERSRFIITSVSVVRAGAIAIVLGELAGLASQVVDIGGSPASTTWRVLVRSSYGQRFLVTAAVALGLLRFLAIVRQLLARGESSTLGIAEVGSAILAGGLIVLAAFASHAGIGGPFALGVLLRVGHLGGIGVWVGGLVVMAVARRRFGGSQCAEVLRSFSPVALCAVAVTAATGFLLAGREVTSLTALLSTGFGDVLIVKLVVLGVALMIGARHASAVRRGRQLRALTLVVEVALALTVVLGGAALATAAPAVGERFEPAAEVLPTYASAKTDDLLVRLTIGPSRPGKNLIRVEFIDSRKPAPAPAESVTVEMTNASGEVVTRSGGPPVDGIIDLESADITSPGPLNVAVRVDRSSRPVAPVSFDWTIGSTQVSRAETVVSDRRIEPFTALAALWVVLLLAGWALIHRWLGKLGDRSFDPIRAPWLFNSRRPWHHATRRRAAPSRSSTGQQNIGDGPKLKALEMIGGECRSEQNGS